MKLLIDKPRDIFLNPFHILILFPHPGNQDALELVDSLNKDQDLTQGIFKFFPIGKKRAESYSLDLNSNINVPLIGMPNENISFYADRISLSQEKNKLKTSLASFLIKVCEHDLSNIEKRINFYGNDNEEDSRRKLFQHLFDELNIVKDNLALWLQFKNNESKNVFLSDSNALEHSIPGHADMFLDYYQDDIKTLKSKYTKRNFDEKDIQKMVDILNDLGSILDEPEYNPDLKIKLEYKPGVQDKVRGCWKTKPMRFFSLFEGDNLLVKLDFQSTDATMLFALMCFRQKEGKWLKREDLLFNNPNSKSISWVKKVFEYLYKGEIYEKWYETLAGKDGLGHRISDTKGKINRTLKSSLKKHPKYLSYLYITADETNTACYYKNGLSKDNVILPTSLSDNEIKE